MQPKNTVFFDLDGLLLDSEGMYYQTRKEILAKYGYDFTPAENKHYIAHGWPDTRRRLAKKVGNEQLGSKILKEALALYRERVREGKIAVKPGAISLLQFLQKRGFKAYVTSSSDKKLTVLNCQKTGLVPYFSGIISGDEVKNNKPAPDIYLHALKVTGAKRNKTVIFEDATTGIAAGLAAGIDVIAVPDRVMPPVKLLTKCTAVLDNLQQAIVLFK